MGPVTWEIMKQIRESRNKRPSWLCFGYGLPTHEKNWIDCIYCLDNYRRNLNG